MDLGRVLPLGVTLPDGAVFVVSETEGRFTSELMDQAAGSWRTTASLPAQTRIDDMVSLRGGTVLAVGTYRAIRTRHRTPIDTIPSPARGRTPTDSHRSGTRSWPCPTAARSQSVEATAASSGEAPAP